MAARPPQARMVKTAPPARVAAMAAAAEKHAAAVQARKDRQTQHAADVATKKAHAQEVKQGKVQARQDARAAKIAARHPSQAGTITNDGTGAAVTPPPAQGGSGSDYASAGSGGTGYGDTYTSNVPGDTPAVDGAAPAAPADKPLIGPKTKIWLIVGGSVVLVVFAYGYYQYRKFTWPLRKFRQVRGALTGLIGAVKS